MNRKLSGLYSGLIATGPMTMFMLAAHEELPERQKSPLSPATLSFQLIKRVTGVQKLSQDAQTAMTILSHFGYGSIAGILYAQTSGRLRTSVLAKGALFGISFWFANYFVLSPALKLRARGPHMTAQRNAMMFWAHVVWGACLSYSEEKLRQSGKEILAGARKAPRAE